MVEGLVSTIIPVYNRPDLLREAVDSVLAQTYQHIEIIVVDDGSDDPAMPASLEDCSRRGEGKVRIVRERNQGPGAARQNGMEHAKGEFVQFLDSDDILYPSKFELQVAMLRRRSEADVVYGKTRNAALIEETERPWKRTGESIAQLFPILLAGRIWDTSTPLYRSEVVKQAGGWSDLINEEDWEFDCRIAAQGVQLAWVDEWVSEQRAHADNRASADGSSDPLKLRDRARARHLILNHALQAGIETSTAEFVEFTHASFLLARQCALAGLCDDAEKLAQRLFEVQPRSLLRWYLLAGHILGFRTSTRVAEILYRMLNGARHRVVA
jgi:hypothetical protein